MSKSEKRAQTFLYIGVLLALIAADWHWYLGEFAEDILRENNYAM